MFSRQEQIELIKEGLEEGESLGQIGRRLNMTPEKIGRLVDEEEDLSDEFRRSRQEHNRNRYRTP